MGGIIISLTQHMAANPTLKVAVFSSGRTQLEIAKRADIHETRLSKIIRGHVEATDEERRRLAKVLRQPVDRLFPEVAA